VSVIRKPISKISPLLALTLLPVGLMAQTAAKVAAKPTANVALKQANAALQREDFAAAEATLRADLKIHPADAEALSLLGLALDGEKKLTEADAEHHRALAVAPKNATIVARYAQHLLAAGDVKGAREAIQQALSLDPADRLANLQLAQSALRQKNPAMALNYLDRIAPGQRDAPDVAAQRLVALDSIPGNKTDADALFSRLSRATEDDAALGSSIGWTLAQAGQYDQAETFLGHAHAADPSDFHVLYDLGVVALYAGHNERAREVLETALREQPNNVDVLYSLAFVASGLHQPEAAIRWLAQAAKLAPERADVQRLLAVSANELGAWEDAAAAWGRYAKLAPNDDEARREHGFATIHQGQFEAGIADLEWYVAKHPDDAMGFFELGAAQSASDPTQGIASLDKSLTLKPDFPAARAVRGSLYYKQGKPEAALPDLEAVASQTQDSAVLDRLGQTYLALERLPDAIRILRKAAELPGEPTVLLHLANALAEAGETADSEALLERYRQARPAQGPVDLMHFLSLTPEQQRADYRTRVEKAIKDNPGDPAAQSHYLKLLLEENQMDQAAAVAHLIAGLKPPSAVLADDGRALLEARQYAPAKELLTSAAASGPSAGLDVDLAIATFHARGDAVGSANAAAEEGLRQLDHAPEASRNADYYLARAQMLEAVGKTNDAFAALDLSIRAEPARAELYWQKAILLNRNHRTPEALQLLDQAVKALPREPAIPLTEAAVLELSGKTGDALRVIDEAQRTWPEVAAVWVARGMILAAHQRFDDALRTLEAAAAHGARSPEAWAALADMTMRSAPDRIDPAKAAVAQALRLAPDDASIQDLAGRIALGKSGDAPPTPAKLFEARPPRDW
jgi:tetratricopeptide (TPR) repeat protein